jgi:hypothetical protein
LLVVGALASLPAALFSPWFLSLPLACTGVAVWLNRGFYRFLAAKGGRAFAAASVPLHLFYYLAAVIGYLAARVLSLAPSRGRRN